jgi:hypothetical protein
MSQVRILSSRFLIALFNGSEIKPGLAFTWLLFEFFVNTTAQVNLLIVHSSLSDVKRLAHYEVAFPL